MRGPALGTGSAVRWTLPQAEEDGVCVGLWGRLSGSGWIFNQTLHVPRGVMLGASQEMRSPSHQPQSLPTSPRPMVGGLRSSQCLSIESCRM